MIQLPPETVAIAREDARFRLGDASSLSSRVTFSRERSSPTRRWSARARTLLASARSARIMPATSPSGMFESSSSRYALASKAAFSC
ncbi:hypothetical protein [Sphingobium yanoikuyae]|uniref:hypothetical protein n=1 Tax=Sphingobium yanoikuyae TaxID=13690 RepID=UPI0022DE9688|nr:hypothetical protein [Sphingobium yanoikuyae]WBQ17506.1 hypothetical protein PAE53_04675 [Sphingobium yanoikuyae]